MGRKSKNGTQIERVLEFVVKAENVDWIVISKKLQIGYLGAQKVVKQLESDGYIQKMEKSNKYKVVRHTLIN